MELAKSFSFPGNSSFPEILDEFRYHKTTCHSVVELAKSFSFPGNSSFPEILEGLLILSPSDLVGNTEGAILRLSK